MSKDTKQELVEQVFQHFEADSLIHLSNIHKRRKLYEESIDLILTTPNVREYWREKIIKLIINSRCDYVINGFDKGYNQAVADLTIAVDKVFTDTGDKDDAGD